MTNIAPFLKTAVDNEQPIALPLLTARQPGTTLGVTIALLFLSRLCLVNC